MLQTHTQLLLYSVAMLGYGTYYVVQNATWIQTLQGNKMLQYWNTYTNDSEFSLFFFTCSLE